MRIILADQHTKPHRELKDMLEDLSEFEQVGEAIDGESLCFIASEQPSDLILIDCDLPGI